MSTAPFRVTQHRWGVRRGHSEIIDQFEESTWSASTYRFGRFNMGMSADRIAREFKISRQEQDEYALRSHQLAARSIDTGLFKDEIVPIDVGTRKGAVRFAVDEAPRRDSSLERLARLPPSFGEGGLVTAGNASGVSDGASALLLMSRRKAERLGVKPLARFLSMARVGVDPQLICMSPGPAGQVAVERAGLKPADIGWWEINEAFASVVLSSCKVLGIGLDKVNPAGGGIALGHPVGNSGCRTMVTLVHAMQRDGVRYGCATIGGGGGIGTAAVIELCE
jgi:acetyl-CoA C-acetyltransferase